MKRIETISVVGLGAIGAAYASRLLASHSEGLRVVVDEARYQRYNHQDVIVNGHSHRFSYVLPEDDVSPVDFVLIAVKYEGLQQALADIQRHVGPETIIMSLLNGISSEEMIASVYGKEKVLHAMCVGIDAVRVDRDVRFSSIGRICFGDVHNGVNSVAVQAVKSLFREAKIPYEVPLDIKRAMWWKFMVNVGINQTSAVLHAPYRVFQEVPEAHELMVMAMREVIVVSQRVGVNLTDDDVATFDAVLGGLSSTGKTSMLQDVEAGRKTEVEYFAGKVAELGHMYGVDTPVNDALLRMIHTLEQMYKS